MPLPAWILWAIAAAGVTALVTFLAAKALRRWLSRPGRVALVGRNLTGKTTMTEILQYGKARRQEYVPTTRPRVTEELQIGEKAFTIVDPGGDRLKDWKLAMHGATDVIYFFDASKVARGDPETLSELDADAEHLQMLRGKQFVTLVGTHTDLFENPDDENLVRSSIEIANLKAACGVDGDGLLLGCLIQKKSGLRIAQKIAERHG